MKILLLHRDKQKLATQQRAEELKKRWKGDEVDIIDAWHLPDGDKYDVIQILFSGGITKIKDFIIKNKHKTWTMLASYRTLEENWDNLDDLKKVYENCRGVVCQNRDLAEKLGRLVKNKAYIIPNGVDEELFYRKFLVGYVGAKDSAGHKGYDLAKKACDELELELYTLNKGIKHEDMPLFYGQIDCLVIASQSEGCNNPTLEALAMNKPIISTRTGIAEELEGVVLVDRNVESIKKALRKLSGRIQILEEYTWDIIARKYHKLYER